VCRRRLRGVVLDRLLGGARTTATPEDRGPPPMLLSEKYPMCGSPLSAELLLAEPCCL
jgi:hypothetical protein